MYRESPFGIMCYRKSSPGLRLPGVPVCEKEEHPGRAWPQTILVTGFENNSGSVDHFCHSVFAMQLI